jgi:hypothetical protein
MNWQNFTKLNDLDKIVDERDEKVGTAVVDFMSAIY